MTTLQPDHVEAATVRGWLDRPDAVTVLDVRTPAEFETAHIRGSYNLPLTLLAEHAEQIAARLDRQVVLVCRSGTRACEAQQHLAGVGADRVHVLDGGLTAYTATVGTNDPTVVRGQPRWALERQVRLVAGTLVLAGLALGLRLPSGPAAHRWGRYRSGPVGAHRHLHDGPAPGGPAVQPWSPGPHPDRGPRPAPHHPAPGRRTAAVSSRNTVGAGPP